MIIVAWTIKLESVKMDADPVLKDHWKSFEDPQAARKAYEKLLEQENLYTAALAGVIDSTDYPGTYDDCSACEHNPEVGN